MSQGVFSYRQAICRGAHHRVFGQRAAGVTEQGGGAPKAGVLRPPPAGVGPQSLGEPQLLGVALLDDRLQRVAERADLADAEPGDLQSRP